MYLKYAKGGVACGHPLLTNPVFRDLTQEMRYLGYSLQPYAYSVSRLPLPGEYPYLHIKGMGTNLSSIETVPPHLKESKINLNREQEEERAWFPVVC